MSRTRRITTHGSGNGKFCDGGSKEIVPCNPGLNETPTAECRTGDIPQDCVLGQWSPWSVCDVKCGKGQQYKSRHIIKDASGGGLTCEDSLKVVQPCELKDCDVDEPVDCVWQDWTSWGTCTRCNGQRYRDRQRGVAQNGGNPCKAGAARETEGCPQDKILCHNVTTCSWADWEPWGSCSKSCGHGGERQRNRKLQIVAGDDVANTQRLYEEHNELQRLTEKLENARMQELVTAFSAGALSLVILFAVVRAAATRSSSERRYARTAQDEHESLVQTLEIDAPEGSWQG